MKLKLHTSTDKIIGALRVSYKAFLKIESLAKKAKVSKQEIIRAILDEVINDVEL